MASEVQICNRGLSWAGLGTITSLTGSEQGAVQCNLHYQDNLETLLEMHPWVFATKRIVLSELATNERSSEWQYQYQRPNQMQMLQWVNDPAVARTRRILGMNPSQPYEMGEQYIWSDVQNACAEYIAKVEDPSLFPAHFRNALSWMMARSVVLPLTEDSRRLEFCEGKAAGAIEAAMAQDATLSLDDTEQPPAHLIERGATPYQSTGYYDYYPVYRTRETS